MTTPFVGREAELAALAADLDGATGGQGGVVLLGGEPGIGKTRLGAEREMVAVISADGVLPGGRLSHTALAAGHLLSDGGHRAARRGG